MSSNQDLFSAPQGMTLDAVLSTAELNQRATRLPDREAETRALLQLAQHLADSPDTILQKLTEVALELVRAGSTGVSLVSPASGDFYWPAIAGAWTHFVGGGTPRHFGPCGVVLERNAAQLFRHPDRYYPYLAATPRLEEVLLIPFYVRGSAVGTVWAVSHDPARLFDAEDQRVLSSLATFAAGSFQAQQTLSSLRESERALRTAKHRLESTLSSNEVATWVWDVQEDRVWADANLARLFAVSAADADGGSLDTYLQAIHRDDRSVVSAAIKRALSAGSRYEVDYRIRRTAGSALWFAARGQVQRDAAGKAVQLSGVLVDITDRKRAEALLIRRSEQLQLLAEAFPRIYGAGDVTAALQVGANEARRVLGAAFARASLDVNDTRGEGLEATSNALASNDEAPDSIRAPSADTQTMAVLSVALVSRDGARLGSLELKGRVGTAFTADDKAVLIQVAHLLAAAVETLRLVSGLEDADRKKDEFLATLSHELRTPLAPLYSGLQLLKLDAPTPADFTRISDMMERQLTQMVRLIDDLMDVSRVSRGRVELRKEWLNLERVVQQAVEASRPSIEAREHRLQLDIDAEPLAVQGDLARLSQVVSNLLHNAAKYTEPGGHITLSVARSGDHVEISVRDTGVGLTPQMKPRVFDLFSQANSSLDKAQGGLGIGLSLAKSLVELHGGTIAVTSKGLGQGSQFTVRLPLATEQRRGPAAPSPALAALAPRRVLIADDNEDATEMLAELLRAHGHEVHVAHDGLEAVEAAVRFEPDAVLLDLGMPRLDGYEAARQIRELLARRPPLLVALTGWGLEDARRRSQQSGFAAHLVKPIEYAKLHELLAR